MRIGRQDLFLAGPLPGWYRRAACVGTDPVLFDGGNEHNERAAVSICRQCPVSLHCLRAALADIHATGVWGGLTEKKRRSIKNRARRRARIVEQRSEPTQRERESQ